MHRLKSNHSVEIVTQTGKGIPNNQFEPTMAITRHPPTKAIGEALLRKHLDSSAHTPSQLKNIKGG